MTTTRRVDRAVAVAETLSRRTDSLVLDQPQHIGVRVGRPGHQTAATDIAPPSRRRPPRHQTDVLAFGVEAHVGELAR